jgi:hypothetical protein
VVAQGRHPAPCPHAVAPQQCSANPLHVHHCQLQEAGARAAGDVAAALLRITPACSHMDVIYHSWHKICTSSLPPQVPSRLAAHDAMHQPIHPEAAAQGPLPSASAMPWGTSAAFMPTPPAGAPALAPGLSTPAAAGTAAAAPVTQWAPSTAMSSTNWQISRRLMLVSDLDDTFVGPEPAADAQTAKLRDVWQQARARGLPCKLVYNTGRWVA